MVSLKSLLLLGTTALSAANPHHLRSPESTLILSDLHALDASVLGLKAAISNYTGGILAATPILIGISQRQPRQPKGLPRLATHLQPKHRRQLHDRELRD